MKCVFRHIFLWMYICGLLQAEEDISRMNIALSADCEPLTTIDNCVNLISGHFFQIENDLTGNTIDPLSLVRYYDSGNYMESFLGMGFGCQFPLLASDIQKGSRHTYAMISERDGFLIPYRGKSDYHEIDPRLLEKGYTNLSRAEISGQGNFVNWRALYKNKSWIVVRGDGSKRLYERSLKLESDKRTQIGFPTSTVYLLTEEVKANGNRLLFDYKKINGKPCLSKVRTVNRVGTTINTLDFLQNSLCLLKLSFLASLLLNFSAICAHMTSKFINKSAQRISILANKASFARSLFDFDYSQGVCSLKSSCGSTVTFSKKAKDCYLCDESPISKQILKKTERSQQEKIEYEMTSGVRPHLEVIKKSGEKIKQVVYERGKVIALKEPLGKNGELVTTYHFQYEKDDTKVFDANNQLKIYRFDSHQRLSRIDYVDFNQFTLIRQEAFKWSSQGWLQTKVICLGNQIYQQHTYSYDNKGNVIRKNLFGNLTGTKPEKFENLKDTDQYTIEYEYSQDKRNLLICKTMPEGLTHSYGYLKDTNLCTHEFVAYNGKIQERIFHFYDDNGQISKTIEDDGSYALSNDLTDVTFRRIKIIHAETTPNLLSFGKPKQIEEYYESNGTMVLLNKTKLSYDERGNEQIRRVFNSQDVFCYETAKNYDARNRVILESNPMGHVRRYQYDDHNNKIEEEICESGKITRYQYDLANRLVCKIEEHLKAPQDSQKEVFTTFYSYSTLNQLICETDRYGHETHYRYDILGRQIQCIKPNVLNVDGAFTTPTVTKQYNNLHQVISQTDENGFTTHFSYNIYGQPTQTTYSDGTVERCVYDPAGWINQKKYADGTTIHYVYDPKGHVIKETTCDASGRILKEEESVYKGPLLLCKKDAMGLCTTYCYDGAGRKVEERVGNYKFTQYTYDDFGRVVKIVRDHSQIDLYTYDWLDQVTSKSLQDSQGTVFASETYAYDLLGNQIQKDVAQDANHVGSYKSAYNSDGTLLWQDDPLNQRTNWLHNHHHTNGIGQRVQSRLMSDPLERLTLEVDDVFHRTNRRDIYEGQQQLSCTQFNYDAKGHLVRQHVLVKSNGETLREYAVCYSYNSRGWLESEAEWPNGKTTRYAYDSRGRMVRKDKPDGVRLNYTYDPLNRLDTLISSDGTVAYKYMYDLHDNLVEIQDHVHHVVQKRSFDLFSRLIQEELCSGVTVTYAYDALDRLTQMTLPDGSYVLYTYDAWHLRHIQRYSAMGQLKFEYACPDYDLRGHLIKGLSTAGETTYQYDILGRNIAIKTPQWQSYLEQFDPVGNLIQIKQIDPSGEQTDTFAYDRFNQLKSERAHCYQYDCIGNCLKKNDQPRSINDLNQVMDDGQSNYTYDGNGNLVAQSNPPIFYTYDALNRLITCTKEGAATHFIYDHFGRCLSIAEAAGNKWLLYQKDQEIGSMCNGQIEEVCVIHPQGEKIFGMELKGEVFFPIQDYRYNICAMQRKDGSLAQWTRYSAFGNKNSFGDNNLHPWGFGSKREIHGLCLFLHRFYNPQLMRWQTPDPIGFKDGLNLYAYVHNNPFQYRDPKGKFAVLLVPLLVGTFGAGGLAISAPTLMMVGSAVGAFATGWAVYEVNKWYDNTYNQVELDEETEKKTKNQGDFKFPENPDELCPELPRDKDGKIQMADNLRVRPEKHPMEEGNTYNPRHHDQHYHVETRRDPSKPNWNHENKEIIKPPNYKPGMGTGFLAGENFPG